MSLRGPCRRYTTHCEGYLSKLSASLWEWCRPRNLRFPIIGCLKRKKLDHKFHIAKYCNKLVMLLSTKIVLTVETWRLLNGKQDLNYELDMQQKSMYQSMSWAVKSWVILFSFLKRFKDNWPCVYKLDISLVIISRFDFHLLICKHPWHPLHLLHSYIFLIVPTFYNGWLHVSFLNTLRCWSTQIERNVCSSSRRHIFLLSLV